MQGFIGIFEILGYRNLLENNTEEDSADTAGHILELIARAREETRNGIRFADGDADMSAEELERRTRWLVFSDRVVFTIRLDDPAAQAQAALEAETKAAEAAAAAAALIPTEAAFVDPEAFILSSSADNSPRSPRSASEDGAAETSTAVQTEAPPEIEEVAEPEELEDTGPIAIDETLAAMCLMSAISSASFFQFIMFQAGLPLRGSLHFGSYHYEDDAGASAGLAGDGVEKASTLCSRLDLSGIVMSPEAYELAYQFCEETEGLGEILGEEVIPYLVPMRSPSGEEKLAAIDWLKGARDTEEYASLDLLQYTHERFWEHGKDIDSEMDTVVHNTLKMLRFFQMMAPSAEAPPTDEEAVEPVAEEQQHPAGWQPTPPGIDLG